MSKNSRSSPSQHAVWCGLSCLAHDAGTDHEKIHCPSAKQRAVGKEKTFYRYMYCNELTNSRDCARESLKCRAS